ncbi:MAG: Fic family protein [Candidatus Omnitrophica bacterium]|nr:Fic family protein [Candidatus Omnitrophota bacterium]
MKKRGRYKATGVEIEFEAGTSQKVLKNLFGIKKQVELDRIENIALKQAEDIFFRKLVREDKRFTAKDIRNMHKVWLGKIYEWAGSYRSVDLEKGNFRFAHAKHIPQLMSDFEKDYLAKQTPCRFKTRDRIVLALAEVHTELVLIHPFREGNGRLARILSTLMALQAGLPLLDFTPIEKGKKKQEYFTAVQIGISKNYKPMQKIFREIIEKSLSRSQE